MPNSAESSIYFEPCAKRVRAMFGGKTIADSIKTLMVWEHNFYPVYYFPPEDVRLDLLGDCGRESSHDVLGQATHFKITVGERQAFGAAWKYPDAPAPAIRNMIRLDWAAMDQWFEEEEEVISHARNPYTRLDILESSRHVQVRIDGEIIADSTRPKMLFETGLPARFYLPREDVRLDLLTPTETSTTCPYKGVASYWDVKVGDKDQSDAVWSYENPLPEAARIAGYMCFYDEKVEMTVDGHDPTAP